MRPVLIVLISVPERVGSLRDQLWSQRLDVVSSYYHVSQEGLARYFLDVDRFFLSKSMMHEQVSQRRMNTVVRVIAQRRQHNNYYVDDPMDLLPRLC